MVFPFRPFMQISVELTSEPEDPLVATFGIRVRSHRAEGRAKYGDYCRHNLSLSLLSSSYTVGVVMAGYTIDKQLAEFGEHVRGWRMVLGLTAQQVSERAGITRDTLRKIETGDPGVSFRNVAQVMRALGQLDKVVDVIDPLNSDIGRLRAGNLTKRRAR